MLEDHSRNSTAKNMSDDASQGDEGSGGSGSSPDAPVGADQPNDEESSPEANSSSGEAGALVLPKLSYKSKTSKEIEVPEEVRERVDTFEVPTGYLRKGSRDQSFIYSWGVNVVPDSSPNPRGTRKNKFYCLANRMCVHQKKPLSTKDSKSGVSKHLHSVHGIVGKLSVARKATKDMTDAAVDVIEDKSRTFGVGRKRYERW